MVQALRAHIITVETFRSAEQWLQDRWFLRVVAGEVFGNATTERGNLLRRNNTVLEERGCKILLNGNKYYSTGSLYADWIKCRRTCHRAAVLASPFTLMRRVWSWSMTWMVLASG